MNGVLLTVLLSFALSVTSEDAPKVRLVGAKNITGKPWRGRVEILHNGQWGTVCDDVWDMNDVNVLCKELGFPRARLPYCCARFGGGNETQPILLAEVHCQGNEKTLLDCRTTGWGPHPNCRHAEDAGVECLKSTTIIKNGNCNFDENDCGYTQDTKDDDFDWTLRTGRTQSYGTGPPYDHTKRTTAGFYMYIETSRPRKYEETARLVSPPIKGKTCLEFYYYMWGIHVNELRVNTNSGKGETLVWHLYGDQGRGWKGARVPIESATIQIVFEGVVGAQYRADIAIDDIVVSNSNNCSSVIPIRAKPDSTNPVKEIRLRGAKVPNAGRVEILHKTKKGDQIWGTVCGDWNWGIEDANVVCRSLHFPGAEMALRSPVFGRGIGKVWLSNLRCSGKEASLSMCPHAGWGRTSCSHYQDASLICKTNATKATDFELRLNGTQSSDLEGRIEMFYGGLWGTIHSRGWDISDANVACRQLQHSGAYNVFISSATYGRGEGPQWVSDFNCLGNETRLSQCNHTFNTYHNWWSHFRDAGVKCYDLRLVGGRTKLEGRVEVRYEGVWGTICSKDWDIKDANVVCRELGYTRAIDNATAKTFGPGSGKIILDGLECFGDEYSLSMCISRGWGIASSDCNHDLDVGVTCEIVKVPPGCDKKKCPVKTVCKSRAKKAYCLCTTTTAVTGCDIPVGNSVVSIVVSEPPRQWNQNNSINDLVKALNSYCSDSSSKCGFDSSSKKVSAEDIIFTKDPSFFGNQLVMEMAAFLPGSQTPISKEVLTTAITNKRSLDGYDVKLVNGKLLAVKKKKSNNTAAIGVGVALAILAVIGLIVLVAFLVKRQIVQGKLRSAVSGGGGEEHAYSQLAVDDDENFDPDAPLLIPPSDVASTEQRT